ncbi:MAG: tRNA nucleotidyltransferase/poly(A) polymerase family protein [Leptospirillum sp.]
MDRLRDAREDFIARNLSAVSRLIFQVIPAPPEGKAFLVGGVVRDIVCLGYGPPDLRDIDLCLEGDMSGWSGLIRARCHVDPVFETRFKTARFWMKSGDRPVHWDIAMARSEFYQHPGSLPIVAPASCLKDLGRRDFSINAMAWPLDGAGCLHGSLIDPFGGRSDISSGLLRVLHARSFQDDPTRIFRGIRLLSRLSFAWETKTQALLDEAVSEKNILFLSGARIRKEFLRGFLEKDPVDVLRRIYLSGLMDSLLPGSVWSESLEASLCETVSVVRAFSDGEPFAPVASSWNFVREWCPGEIFFYLVMLQKLRSEEIDRAMNILGLVGKFGSVIREIILNPIEDSSGWGNPKNLLRHLYRYLLDAGSRHDLVDSPGRIDDRMNFLSSLSLFSGKEAVTPFLRGADLIQLGIPPGRRVGEILRSLGEKAREGRITSRKEAIDWVRTEILRMPAPTTKHESPS